MAGGVRKVSWFIAVAVTMTSAVGLILSAPLPRADTVGSYDNASITDVALRYVGRWGSAACVDAGASGYQGGASLGDSDDMDGA